jgi:mutator protein MutT
MRPLNYFEFCPRCAHRGIKDSARGAFRCDECGFVYFLNPATAAAAFILNADGQVLFIRRAKEPAKGKLALPGGFVDAGETAEEAVRREIREEVGLEMDSIAYLDSQPNEYPYKEVTYPVLDLFFVGRAKAVETVAALDGVESYCWLKPQTVAAEEIAFASIRNALAAYLRRMR